MSELNVNKISHSNGTDAINIDSGGRASFPKAKVPSFHVYRSSNQTLSSGTDAQVAYNANYFLNDWTLNASGDITCGANGAGIYMIHVGGRINTSADNNASMKLLLNGTGNSDGIGSSYCYSEYYQGLDITALMEIAAGDVLRVYMAQNTGSDRTIGNLDYGYHAKCMAYRISV